MDDDKKMLTVEFSEAQVKNLIAFLARVDLKGAEVGAYVQIVNAINQAKERANEH
jgi:DUF971 family protein